MPSATVSSTASATPRAPGVASAISPSCRAREPRATRRATSSESAAPKLACVSASRSSRSPAPASTSCAALLYWSGILPTASEATPPNSASNADDGPPWCTAMVTLGWAKSACCGSHTSICTRGPGVTPQRARVSGSRRPNTALNRGWPGAVAVSALRWVRMAASCASSRLTKRPKTTTRTSSESSMRACKGCNATVCDSGVDWR
mmetsp:Transcript_25945/g.59962  ORF Transcript_25945/g.59962 Transcript_25945/m.59962 type:complete len:205 (+) Transcript_25945:357-971(+)